MKILFIGQKKGNSYLQYKCFNKRFKKVDFINTSKILPLFEISIKIFFNFSPFIFENYLNKKILKQVNNKYDLIYVKSGEYIGEKLILKLKKKNKKNNLFL